MKKTKILYWIFTGIFAALMLLSSIPDVMMDADAVKFMTELGYPRYFIPFIGVAKILGVIAILIPGYPRIKEWAYAGLAFDLIGASYSVISSGAPVSGWAMMSIWFIFLVLSYVWYRKIAPPGLAPVRQAHHSREEVSGDRVVYSRH
ncbi:MAG: DoxX family protein [Bacteroidota bacterium]